MSPSALLPLLAAPDRSVREFIILRYVLIIAVSALVIAQRNEAPVAPQRALLVAAALASNVMLNLLPPARLSSWPVVGLIVILDTLWISASLLTIGTAGREFFFLYFFVVFFAALSDNLVLMLVGVVAASTAYLWILTQLHPGPDPTWQQEYLMHITFLFSAALFYGALVNRVRIHRRRSEMLETSDRARTELLATVVHDIGHPAHVIGVGLQSIEEKLAAGEHEGARSLLGLVERNSQHLNRLIQQLLEYARTRSERHRIDLTEVSVNRVVERVAARYKHQAEQRGVQMTLSLEAIPPVVADELCLVRMLDNLLANALGHTKPGTTVIIETAPEGESFRITVGDSGQGLTSAQLSEVGQPFSPAAREQGSTGLGLYIVRSLAETHGGTLTADSGVGEGSRFTVHLPCVAVSAPTGQAAC